MSPPSTDWIWLDAVYTRAQAARVCRVEYHQIGWAIASGAIATRPDGTIGGLALFCWYARDRFGDE